MNDEKALWYYFAGKALQVCYEEHWNAVRAKEISIDPEWKIGVAMDACAMADAMLTVSKSRSPL